MVENAERQQQKHEEETDASLKLKERRISSGRERKPKRKPKGQRKMLPRLHERACARRRKSRGSPLVILEKTPARRTLEMRR